MSLVFLENVKGIQANVVSIDNIKTMKKAVMFLIDNGHYLRSLQ